MKSHWYLVVEDQATKAVNYRRFEQQYQTVDDDFQFVIAYTPKHAFQLLTDVRRPSGLVGVIADFSLSASRPDSVDRAEVPAELDPDGVGYQIQTGLGVLDWVHHIEPDISLWTLTDVTAGHAPLFMGAGFLWLGAMPLSVGRFTQLGALSDQLFAELRDPAKSPKINPIWSNAEDAAAAFETLLNRSYNGIESFDCLRAMIAMSWSIASRGFEKPYVDALRRVTGREEVNFWTQTFARDMTLWQWALEDMYRKFPTVNTKAERWPHFTVEQQALKAWADFNPFTDFLARNHQCEEFFTAPDVAIAFRRWRRRHSQPE